MEKKKPPIVYILAVLGGIIALIAIGSGIKDFQKANQTETKSASTEDKTKADVINGNYYLGNENLHVLVIKFSDENLAQIVDCGLGRKTDKLKKTYATYSIDKNSLVITLSNGLKYNMIIHNDGQALSLNNNEFNIVEPSDLSDRTLEQFE